MKNTLYNQTIFANSPYGLAITDLNGRFVDVNPIFARLVDLSVSQIKDLCYRDITTTISREQFAQYADALSAGEKIGPVPDGYQHISGNKINVLVSATLLEDGEDRLICWFIEETSQDSQHRKISKGNQLSAYDLALSAAQAKSILKTAVDGIITITQDGIIHSFNPAAEKMFGYTAEEILGNNISMLMPEPHSKNHDSYISNYLQGGEAKIIGIGRESVAKRKDGTTFHIHLAVSEIKVDGLVLFTGIISDISNIKRVQHDLEVSEERFRRSQRSANIGTWDWNIKTGELYWSEQIFALFGYRENELKTTYENFLQAVHPEDRQHVIDAVNNCINKGDKYDIEHRCVWPDGTVRWMSERGDVYRDENGEPSHMLGVVQDITLRKNAENALLESEESFRGAFEFAAHGMAIVSTDGRLVKINRSFCELVGYPEEELLSTTLKVLTHPDDFPASNTGLNELLSGERKYFQSENRFIHKQGDIIWVLTSVSLVRDLTGTFSHYICQFIDISGRKRAESALTKAKEQAENANQAKSEFLSSMSHELRTPLNAILGFTELLEQGENLDSQQVKDLSEIKKASYHLLNLIGDILDLAKIESRQLKLRIESLDLTDQITECCKLIQQQADYKNIAIINKCMTQDNETIPISGDKLRVKQIILNLLSNAVKYNCNHGTIIISCQNSTDNLVRLSISDTGVGLSSEKLQNLFQPFNRLGAENSNVEGTGIGLIITKNLVEKMGGRIGVYSTEDKGSTFWVEFSRSNTKDVAPTKNKHVTGLSTVDASRAFSRSDHRILVIEDNPTGRTLIRSQLEKLGYGVDTVATGHDGVEMWSNGDYSAILTDINLPDINGMQLARTFKENAAPGNMHIPVIAITANALNGDKEKYLEAGLDDYISKPIELGTLDEVLKSWLCKHDTCMTDPAASQIQEKPFNNNNPAPVDLSILNRYIGDDPVLQKRILNSFRKRAPEIIHNIVRATDDKCCEDIVMEAHKLKSTARTIGANALAQSCEILENISDNPDWKQVSALARDLQAQSSEVNHYLFHDIGQQIAIPVLSDITRLETLIVDDDPFMIEHTTCVLKRLGFEKLHPVNSGGKALDILNDKDIHDIKLIFCDLNMPGMDGIEFLRHLSEIEYPGKIVLISGVNNNVLKSAERLAKAQNLDILGTMEKPISPELCKNLLFPADNDSLAK